MENTIENTSNVTVQKMPEIIEGTWNPLEVETFFETEFDSNGDGCMETWNMEIAKVDKGFAVAMDVIPQTFSYHYPEDFYRPYNVFLSETDSLKFENDGESLWVVASKDGKDTKYAVSVYEENIILTNSEDGTLMPYYGKQERPEGNR